MKKKLIEYEDVASEWHPTKNDKDINTISGGSKHKVWWLGKCGHEYQMRVESRTNKNKSGCPYCNRKKISNVLSATNPNLIEEWHPIKNGKLQIINLTAGSHKRMWWLGKCGHEWQATVCNRSKNKRPSGCPFCAGKVLCDQTSLTITYPQIAMEWHPDKNNVSPSKVHYGTWKKYWWLGKCGHEWYASVHTRTRRMATGCPWCYRSRGEERISQVLDNLGLEYKQQVRFDTCRDKRPLVFDFQVGNNVLIEYQGRQHFEPMSYKDSMGMFANVIKRDQIKRDWCPKNGFKLVEIPYTQYKDISNIIEREVYHP